MSELVDPRLAFATEETYLHATDRAAEQATETLLAVEIEHEVYGIATGSVREIIRVGEITEVPRTPPFVLGVISVRGAIIPVLDMRRRLGFAPMAPRRSARIVIVAVGTQRFGLLVDDVVGLERFRSAEVEPAPAIFGTRGAAERHIQGVGRAIDRPDRIVIFLDLHPLLELAREMAAFRTTHADEGEDAR